MTLVTHSQPGLYLDGAWILPSRRTLDVFDSTDGSQLGQALVATADDVDDAVRAARAAFPAWAESDPQERGRLCRRIADGLEERSAELADLLTRETGMPLEQSKRLQVASAIGCFRDAAAIAESYEFSTSSGSTEVVKEPTGVVACITPWNFPLQQIAGKVAFALAAGCTVVLKPSEIAPLDAFVLTEVIDSIAPAPGLFNLVTGDGTTGAALSGHPGIDMVSFTGSTSTGGRVAALAAPAITRVRLELGGKSANVILDDLSTEELEAAVDFGVRRCMVNAGQTCSALTRMLVPNDRLAEAEELVRDKVVAEYRPSNPFEPGAKLGPLASAAQRARVRGYIEEGISDGAKLVVGGPGAPDAPLDVGYYVEPTVFSEVHGAMGVARTEIFGPVLCIMPYDDEGDAVRIANDTEYGLSGAVWAADSKRAEHVARQLRTGQVAINGGAFDPRAPFGGFGRSGYGREYGVHGFEEFLETKAMLR